MRREEREGGREQERDGGWREEEKERGRVVPDKLVVFRRDEALGLHLASDRNGLSITMRSRPKERRRGRWERMGRRNITSILVPLRATILPKSPSQASFAAMVPNLVARTRS